MFLRLEMKNKTLFFIIKVLLLIDAKSGFEMETFEFLNICQVHGMPRLMGVLTHLDMFKNKKTLQKTKTILKKRYRLEIPRVCLIFFLYLLNKYFIFSYFRILN